MSLFKVITLVAPLALRGTNKPTATMVLERSLAATLGLFGATAFLIAGFVYLNRVTNLEIAFLALSSVLITLSALIFYKSNRQARAKRKASSINGRKESMTDNLPDAVKEDPLFKSIVGKIEEHPIPSTLAALTLGLALANEFLGD